MTTATKAPPFREIKDGTLRLNFHPGQTRTHRSKKRKVAMLAGSQGGKTCYGPHWLDREIRTKGPGDYIVGTATFPLLSLKLLPELLYVFEDLFHYGTYSEQRKLFTFWSKQTRRSETDYVLFPDADIPTRIIICSAQNPESMESATVKGGWLDECVAPETLIETEVGSLPISEIVDKQLHIRVWSFDTVNNEWSLKPIVRWIKLPQRKPLLRIGNLRLTGNHKVWTKDGYVRADNLITSANYAILRAEVIKDEKSRIQTFRRDSPKDEEICQTSDSGTRCESICQFEEALSGASRARAGNSRTPEAKVCQSSQSPLGTDWGRTFLAFGTITDTTVKAYDETTIVGTRGQWQTEELETGVVGEGSRMFQRICGSDRQGLASALLQDRCGDITTKDCHRSRKCSESSQERMVFSQWMDISSLLKSHGGDLDGGLSKDGFVYNLEVEGNHNYIADGILVSNCGQKQFKRETHEAYERRTLIHQARTLYTTTLYGLGWLKTEIYDPWFNKTDPDIDVIQFDSTENPLFPRVEYDRMKASMPDWKFQMFHRGRFSRPAGMIYNAFDSTTQVIPPFEIPVNWPRYVGHDFGPVNTVALWAAMNPATGELFIYREYVMSGLSTFEHVSNWIDLSRGERIDTRYGGSQTEEGWRGDFTQAGWRIDKPLEKSVEAGIQKVYGYEKLGKKKVFSTCPNYISEKQSYSRELDDMYNATDKIENKSIYHLMDSERYLVSQFNPIGTGAFGDDAELAPVVRRV